MAVFDEILCVQQFFRARARVQARGAYARVQARGACARCARVRTQTNALSK